MGLLVPGKHSGIETIRTSKGTYGDELKALTWHGKRDVRVDNVSDPTIREPTDAVVRMTTTAICGSDLHLYEVLTPFMEEGPRGYEIFQKKEAHAVKVLLKPWPEQTALRRGEGGSSDR